ncbi:MAG: phosphate acyltransferase PlsX, partial [Phycisphaerales bacterium]|nr:phosphate acyltransferase PlsX [Phycisphaerales bacterium]
GPKETVEAECGAIGFSDSRIRFEHCTQVIGMDDSPVDGLRQKRDSSIVRMANDGAKDLVDALISAGNTGAFAGACQLKIGAMDGVSRPGIAILMPTFHGPVIICDVGANVAPKPRHLYEYARLSAVYAKVVLKIDDPKIGIVSIGEEAGKGNTLVKEAFALMRDDPALTFIGNVEGRDIFAGAGNVFICDGFTGNVTLKLTEGLAEGLFKTIRHELLQESGPELAKQFEPVVERIWKRHDFAEHGGAPLLGLRKVAIICHGRSDQRAIANAIRVAVEQVRLGIIDLMAQDLAGVREGAE